MKEFKINEHLTLKLIGDKTVIYIKAKLFTHCKYLLLNIPKDEIEALDQIGSIDAAEVILDKSLEKPKDQQRFQITPETEFWAHCSNLQAWYENNYDTRLLHRNLAFPLLNKLTEIGDSKAKIVLKEEIAKRLSSGNENVAEYLINEGYVNHLTHEEQITAILNPAEAEALMDLEEFTGNPFVQAGSRNFFDTGVETEPFQQFLVRNKSVVALLIFWYDKPNKPLPESISVFKSLEELIYMGENINSFPESIKELKSLKKLYVSSEILEEVPNFVTKIPCLEHLSIRSPLLIEIPKNIGNLKNLKVLSVGSRINMLPDSISKLKKLEYIYLNNNPLDRIPDYVFNLKNLKELNIENTKLEKIPDSIYKLENLEVINLKRNNLNEIPEVLLTLKKLRSIFVDQKNLSEDSIEMLKKLKKKGITVF